MHFLHQCSIAYIFVRLLNVNMFKFKYLFCGKIWNLQFDVVTMLEFCFTPGKTTNLIPYVIDVVFTIIWWRSASGVLVFDRDLKHTQSRAHKVVFVAWTKGFLLSSQLKQMSMRIDKGHLKTKLCYDKRSYYIDITKLFRRIEWHSIQYEISCKVVLTSYKYWI